LGIATYGEFSSALHAKLSERRTPVDVTLEITHRCPLACRHCYNNLPMSDRAAAQRELSFEEYCKLLDELADAGTFWILFSGGEPFARPDFLDIYTYAKQKGFLITVFTNGTVFTRAIVEHLAEYPPFAIEITLYGRTRETYERLTQQPGSYDRCMRGIELLLERKLPLKLKTVPTSINKHEVFEMRRFAEELGVEFKFDAQVNPRIDCSQSPLGVRLSAAEVVAFDYVDPARKAEYRRLFEHDRENDPPPADDVYFCGGGVRSCAVDPYGNMSICVISQHTKYNIRETGFMTGWDTILRERRNRKRTRPSKCQTCRIQSLCSMCPANGELENQDAESPVEFLCEAAHLRAMGLGETAPAHGDCEFCVGGARHEELRRSVEKLPLIMEQLPVPHHALLPVLNAVGRSCESGDCGH
jgi:radical SAM protein with 4Fe4S-binding SPASM domain